MIRHLKSFLAWGGGIRTKNYCSKIQMPRGGGVLKLPFDWYIKFTLFDLNLMQVLDIYSESNKSKLMYL